MTSFVKQERIDRDSSIIRTLLKFIWDAKLLRYFFVISFVASFASAAAPQFFLWSLGKFANCDSQSLCREAFFIFGKQFYLSFDLQLFASLFLIAFFSRFLALTTLELFGLWSSQDIHRKMIKGLMGVRTTFFDENPSGRLINRIVGEYATVRLNGVMQIADTLHTSTELFCMVLIVALGDPRPALAIIPILWFYLFFQSRFAPMVKRLRELIAIASGEIMHRETDLIEGRDIFSFYGRQKNLLDRVYQSYIDRVNLEIFRGRLMGWGVLWRGVASSIFAILVYFFTTIGLIDGAISQALAAVIISVLFGLEGNILWVSIATTNLSNTATHVRRIYNYSDLLPEHMEEKKDPTIQPSKLIKAYKNSSIQFENYSMSYRPGGPLILKNINLEIPYGAHIGIVGRTGSGKSSLIQALMRMVYVADGDIKFGRHSIYDLEIQEYRSLFGLVPQDPYLFSGTVRSTLTSIAENVEKKKIKEILKCLNASLQIDDIIEEGGKNLSVGQRQLLALGRVLLAKRPYIILDEPTSAIDNATDKIIQNFVREKFEKCTVITIAHRKESFVNCDLIVELEDGKIVASQTAKHPSPNRLKSVFKKNSRGSGRRRHRQK